MTCLRLRRREIDVEGVLSGLRGRKRGHGLRVGEGERWHRGKGVRKRGKTGRDGRQFAERDLLASPESFVLLREAVEIN